MQLLCNPTDPHISTNLREVSQTGFSKHSNGCKLWSWHVWTWFERQIIHLPAKHVLRVWNPFKTMTSYVICGGIVICYTTNAARYNFVSSQYSESVHFIIRKENRSNKIMIFYMVWYNKSSWIIDSCFILHTTNLALSNLTCCTGIHFRWKSWEHCVISGQRVTRR